MQLAVNYKYIKYIVSNLFKNIVSYLIENLCAQSLLFYLPTQTEFVFKFPYMYTFGELGNRSAFTFSSEFYQVFF
jgi:hypothetical protein